MPKSGARSRSKSGSAPKGAAAAGRRPRCAAPNNLQAAASVCRSSASAIITASDSSARMRAIGSLASRSRRTHWGARSTTLRPLSVSSPVMARLWQRRRRAATPRLRTRVYRSDAKEQQRVRFDRSAPCQLSRGRRYRLFCPIIARQFNHARFDDEPAEFDELKRALTPHDLPLAHLVTRLHCFKPMPHGRRHRVIRRTTIRSHRSLALVTQKETRAHLAPALIWVWVFRRCDAGQCAGEHVGIE